MTRDDMLRMAREAGFEICVAGVGVPQMRLAGGPVDAPWLRDALDRFAAMVAAAEREACAKVCEAERRLGIDDERAYHGELMAAAMRARSAT